jgi:DNA-directed RNA polymerase subunit N (RpoN/RPB10)
MLTEVASTENVSSWGGRVRTKRLWKPDVHVFVKSSNRNFWARARVVYCQTLQNTTHALGLEFYATAHRYNLTFRCISCGRYEASANYRSDRIESEDQIKARIYPVRCAGCGWKGEACGFSVIRVLRYKSRETFNPGENVVHLKKFASTTK